VRAVAPAGSCRMKTLSIVVPVFNEEESLEFAHGRLAGLAAPGMLPVDRVELIYVNDGSRDRSAWLLERLAAPRVGNLETRVVHFSRNFGHSAAVVAGLAESTGDAIAIIDADLQDPPELIPEMLALVGQGWDVVYGQRTERRGETVFKAATAWAFYRLLRWLTGVDIPRDAGDFRVITGEVRDAVLACRDQEPFLRGLVAWVGFQQKAFPYARDARRFGRTKYPFRKMVRFATNAILSFSSAPLRVAMHLGTAGLVFSAGFGVWALWTKLAGRAISGWTSTLLGLLVGQSCVLLCIGLVGTYTARIYSQSQGRPRYLVRRRPEWPRRD